VTAALVRRAALALTPAALAAAVFGLDRIQYSGWHPVAVIGALDEPAHLATAALALLAVAGPVRLRRYRLGTATALVCSVAIDLDHLPLYAGVPYWSDGGRPYTHSLATVVALLSVSVVGRRWRRLWQGAGIGVLLHLARDVATGPGVLLLWPLTRQPVLLPYAAYAGAVVLLAVVATGRLLLERRPPRPAV
jgi:inner membrane protein